MDTNSSPSQNNNANSYAEYLARAAQACAAGDVVLGLHLYLAAYERSLRDSHTPDPSVIEGLRQAWNLACEHKERSLAEYIFEKLEPYLSADEVTQFAGKLQRLALDKLEEFGLSREDLEDMTDMISQDFFGMDPSTLLMRFEQGNPSMNMFGALQRGLVRDHGVEDLEDDAIEDKEPKDVANEVNEDSDHESSSSSKEASLKKEPIEHANASKDTLQELSASTNEPADNKEEKAAPDTSLKKEEGGSSKKNSIESKSSNTDSNLLPGLMPVDGTQGLFTLPNFSNATKEMNTQFTERTTYHDLVGFENAIDVMRGFGIGMENDPDFKELVQTLNTRHGLSRIPATDSFLFRSPVREDANQFMLATMGEIGLPAIRMRMEENLQGMPVLCVMASSDNHPRMNAARNAIEGGGVLILEDIDMWGTPLTEAGNEEMGGFMYAQLSRGAREAMNLIRSAVENPEVYVLVSAAKDSSIDGFFFEFLEPLTVVDIELPDASERADLWANIVKEHPSLRSIDRGSLVRYSADMSRFDIYMAAREAVEEAYKASLVARKFMPVTSENVFEKIAAYQPLESEEYKQLEDAVIDTFRSELDQIDDLLKGTSD